MSFCGKPFSNWIPLLNNNKKSKKALVRRKEQNKRKGRGGGDWAEYPHDGDAISGGGVEGEFEKRGVMDSGDGIAARCSPRDVLRESLLAAGHGWPLRPINCFEFRVFWAMYAHLLCLSIYL